MKLQQRNNKKYLGKEVLLTGALSAFCAQALIGFGTDLEELHQFARLIGIKREWYQYVGFPHYDLTRNKRSLAIMKGAKRIAPGLIPKGVILYDPNNG